MTRAEPFAPTFDANRTFSSREADDGNVTDDVDAVADEFADLASWCAGSSPLYERLCAVVADDAVLLDVAADHTPGQPAPQLFLAAIQAELFASDATVATGSTDVTDDPGSVDGALAAYYPSVVDDPRPPDDDLAPAVREFVRAHEPAIRERVGSRRVQTNAVRRCGALYSGFATIADRVDGDALALLEVGSSAGLHQHWDRYEYAYRVPAGVHRVGATDSPVLVDVDVRDGPTPPLPGTPPAVASRVGVDVNPLDPTDDADARWLRALVWPEHDDRRRVLDDALAVAREHPPAVVEGDAVTDLHAVVDRLPADAPLVVFHSLVLYQFDADARQAFYDALAAVAADRDAPTFHLAGERPDPDRENGIQLRLARIDGTDSDAHESEHLGTFEQHGAWLAWRDDDESDHDAGRQQGVHEDP